MINNFIHAPLPRKGWVRWYSQVTFNLGSSLVLQFLQQVLRLYYLYFLHVENVTAPRSWPKKAAEKNNSLNCLTSERKWSWALWTFGLTFVLTQFPCFTQSTSSVLQTLYQFSFSQLQSVITRQKIVKRSSQSCCSVLQSIMKTSWKASIENHAGFHSRSVPLAACRLWSTQSNWSLHPVCRSVLHVPALHFLMASPSWHPDTWQPEKAVTGWHRSHELSLWQGGTGLRQIWIRSGKNTLPYGSDLWDSSGVLPLFLSRGKILWSWKHWDTYSPQKHLLLLT